MDKTREQLWNKHKFQAEFRVKTIKIYSGIISAFDCCSAESKRAGVVRATHTFRDFSLEKECFLLTFVS